MENKELNQNELHILDCCRNSMLECAGGDFTYGSEVTSPILSKNQVKGYLSQLQQKGYIAINEDLSGQLHFRAKARPFVCGEGVDTGGIDGINFTW